MSPTGDVQRFILQSVFQEKLEAFSLASGLVHASTDYLTCFGGCVKEDQLNCYVVCVYEMCPFRFFKYIEDQILNRELYNDSPNTRILDCVQEDRLGVTGEGLWVSATAHSSIRPTARGV